jgi:hypothetical protein
MMVRGMTILHVVDCALLFLLGKAGFSRTTTVQGNCFGNFTFVQASFGTNY